MNYNQNDTAIENLNPINAYEAETVALAGVYDADNIKALEESSTGITDGYLKKTETGWRFETSIPEAQTAAFASNGIYSGTCVKTNTTHTISITGYDGKRQIIPIIVKFMSAYVAGDSVQLSIDGSAKTTTVKLLNTSISTLPNNIFTAGEISMIYAEISGNSVTIYLTPAISFWTT